MRTYVRMVVCVHIPRFELSVAAGEGSKVARQTLAGRALAVAPLVGGEQRVGEVSGAAEARGVARGMVLGEALARCPDLVLVPGDPVAVAEAWEATLRSPSLWRHGQFHLAYSNQIAEQRGNITGGLICTPVGDPACDAGFAYTPVDHDQRNTLNLGFNATLPMRFTASTNIYYGSGFTNGDPDPATPYPYLPSHTTFDLSLGKSFRENYSLAVTALNVANRHLLVDNSVTFGGFHYNDPREIYVEFRYKFHY